MCAKVGIQIGFSNTDLTIKLKKMDNFYFK